MQKNQPRLTPFRLVFRVVGSVLVIFQSLRIIYGHFFAISWDFDFEGLESRKIIHKSNFGTKIIEIN